MSGAFDPYHKWLGISPKDQPPDLYRLLAIDKFESDSDVIDAAADQRMAHLHSFRAGAHGAESQRMMSEISEARILLLDSSRKSAYDEQLRSGKGPPLRNPPRIGPPPINTATHVRKRRRWRSIALAMMVWAILITAGVFAAREVINRYADLGTPLANKDSNARDDDDIDSSSRRKSHRKTADEKTADKERSSNSGKGVSTTSPTRPTTRPHAPAAKAGSTSVPTNDSLEDPFSALNTTATEVEESADQNGAGVGGDSRNANTKDVIERDKDPPSHGSPSTDRGDNAAGSSVAGSTDDNAGTAQFPAKQNGSSGNGSAGRQDPSTMNSSSDGKDRDQSGDDDDDGGKVDDEANGEEADDEDDDEQKEVEDTLAKSLESLHAEFQQCSTTNQYADLARAAALLYDRAVLRNQLQIASDGAALALLAARKAESISLERSATLRVIELRQLLDQVREPASE